MNNMKILAIIPARGGSKGLPGKNIRPLCGKPLICYSIDVAREVVPDADICVTTDDPKIIQVVEDYGLPVPFVRPAELASDTATTSDTLLHALDYYQSVGCTYEAVLLLQPTSPLRRVEQVREAVDLFAAHRDVDMVVSVRVSHAPAVLCHDNADGYLESVLTHATRRQDAPEYYEYNGCIYVISVASLRSKGMPGFSRRLKYVMPEEDSMDIDTLTDFEIVSSLMQHRLYGE